MFTNIYRTVLDWLNGELTEEEKHQINLTVMRVKMMHEELSHGRLIQDHRDLV